MNLEARRQETRLVVATRNTGKLQELSRFLPPSTELLSLADLDVPSPEETGCSFLDNAILKAEYASTVTGLAALADDSGLEVDALRGRPGIYSARFAGPCASDAENNLKLVCELRSRGDAPWTARFVCAVALCDAKHQPLAALGHLNGIIVEQARGTNGFGYDPHFQIDDPDAGNVNRMTLAELTSDQKNALSHRRRAYDALVKRARPMTDGFPAARLLVDDD